MKKRFLTLLLGALLGIALGNASTALAADITATRSTQPVFVDGRQVQLEAFAIGGNNYVKLRDVGKVLDVNVYWDGSAVQVDTHMAYTGVPPATRFTQPAELATVPSTPYPITQTAAVRTGSKAEPSSRDIEALRQEMVERTNAVRAQNGLPALPADPMLMKAAQVRAEEMAATSTYSHTRPDGSDRKSVTDCPYASENIHRIWDIFLEQQGLGLAEFCVNSWASSEGHRQNMLQNNRRAIGVGLARGVNELGQPCWYCVQWFLRDGYAITWVDTPKIP